MTSPLRCRFLPLLLGVALLAGCSPRRPSGVLSERELTGVILDLSILNGAFTARHLSVIESPNAYLHYYDQVMQAHHTDSLTLSRSLDWYARYDGKALMQVYQTVEDSLVARRERLSE